MDFENKQGERGPFLKKSSPLPLSRYGSVTLAFCRRTVAAFIALTPLRYPSPFKKHGQGE